MNEMICYCYGYTAGDLEKDIFDHGRSSLMKKIIAESKAGNCKKNNPKGR